MDRIEVTIEEDGTITVVTPGISGKNHHKADELLAALKALTGKPKIKKRGRHVHNHNHNEVKA